MKKYAKEEAISIVVQCAEKYHTELEGKTLLFICTDKHKRTVPIEFSFYGNNYMHLTGLKPSRQTADASTGLFANDFYLSPQELQNVEEIIDQLRPHIRDISPRTYYRKRKEAVEVLSSVLWGYTAQDSAGIVKEFFQ